MSPQSPPRFDASVVWLDAVDSTNSVAARLVATWEDGDRGASSDVLVVAGEQLAGRGRGDNRWLSPAGGIYASLVTTIAPQLLAVVPKAAGVAAAEAVETVVPTAKVGLKWPNDLLVAGRKLGGILCQSKTMGPRSIVVIGVGLNVGDVRSDELAVPATGLQSLGLEDRGEDATWPFLAAFVTNFRTGLEDIGSLHQRWASRSVHAVGDRLRFRWPGGEVEGTFQGFGDDGALILEVDGEARRFAAGELVAPLDAGGE